MSSHRKSSNSPIGPRVSGVQIRNKRSTGPIKTFVLRGIKDSPPYLHNGRLLSLDDTVEFFNVVGGTQLTEMEKKEPYGFFAGLIIGEGEKFGSTYLSIHV